MMENLTTGRPRAGFWRRLLALTIDVLVVTIPLELILVALFAYSNGGVQGAYGISSTLCVGKDQLPSGIEPPPPAGYNLIQECSSSFFGFQTARYLIVSKVTQNGNTTVTINQSYWLGGDGVPRADVLNTNWIAVILLFAYLVLMEHRLGMTAGKRVAGVRVVDVEDPDRSGIPLMKAFGRQLGLSLGAIVMVGAAFAGLSFLGFENGAPTHVDAFIMMIVLVGLVNLAWLLWIVVSVARKRDPIYDRLARTAVLRT